MPATATQMKPIRPARPAGPSHGVARLTLTVNGQSYAVRPIPTDDRDVSRAFRLRKADGTVYDVARTRHGFSCDCADHTYRREGLTDAPCKHAAALAAVGLL